MADQADSTPPSSNAQNQERPHPVSAPQSEITAQGILETPSHGIEINFPPTAAGAGEQSGRTDGSPQYVRHMSMPTYASPIRHHRRTPSRTKKVKETLNARSHYGSRDGDEDDGRNVHRINQYEIKEEIGRGSFGAVYRAIDQYGVEYCGNKAVKEFSKSRLRKRANSNLLRQGPNGKQRRPGHLAAGAGFNAPLHRRTSEDRKGEVDSNNSLNLIKEEIAIMKKLSHNNLVALHEVLDDPDEDSLYMIMDMCKKGVVMKVDLGSRADPYDEEVCRCWFRDMILGIEYLHAQGVVHRDIKPDNCLITDDDVLKIVDFGVSEMFEKQSDMATAKSAGSPAFMAPELCVVKHGEISGRAADIWSMGVTLYCLRYGHIPFEKDNMLELYDSIRDDELVIEDEEDKTFEDLIRRLLEKDSKKRITIEEMREHDWITKNGEDPLLSAEENCADLVEPPTQIEMNHAITSNMGNLMSMMRAVKRFKALLSRKRPHVLDGMFGRDSRIVQPPHSLRPRVQGDAAPARSLDAHDRKPMERALTVEGLHRDVPINDEMEKLPKGMDHLVKVASSPDEALQRKDSEQPSTPEKHERQDERPETTPSDHRSTPKSTVSRAFTFPDENDTAKGHAHNPLLDTAFLDIGLDPDDPELHGSPDHPVVAESPPAVDMNIYEQAYQDEMKRIAEARGEKPAMFLNRRVEHREDLKNHAVILDHPIKAAGKVAERMGLTGKSGGGGFAKLIRQAKERQDAGNVGGEEDGEVRGEGAGDEQDDAARALADPKALPAEEDEAGDNVQDDLPDRTARPQRPLEGLRGSMALDMPGAFPMTPEAGASKRLG
ncbi:hypothetical protein B0A48_09604 [Cryoendolithus antarcticus]|uniref:Protein kinase domain-containing protein n=1 Tax=Cryoendolithus antarcticus TaxID=1507870 RepID=A0A1V8T0J5_9PEZI|nr:hypothetical protein B0A48_09604 [Cryoendolithus antarcticus]